MIDVFVFLGILFTNPNAANNETVDEIARGFRIQTYRSYRQNRSELDRRNSIAQRMIQDWRSGHNDLTHQQLVAWLRAASQHPDRDLPPFPVRQNSAQKTESSMQSKMSIDVSLWPPAKRKKINHPIPRVPPSSRLEVDIDFPNEPVKLPSKGGGLPIGTSTVPMIPVQSPNQFDPSIEPDIFAINISVLTARIESENIGFKAIEARLYESKTMPTSELEFMVNELDKLLAKQRLSQLYRKLLSASHRRHVPRAIDTKPILTTLGRRIFEIETTMAGQFKEDSQEVERLRRISKRVQSWEN